MSKSVELLAGSEDSEPVPAGEYQRLDVIRDVVYVSQDLRHISHDESRTDPVLAKSFFSKPQ